MCGIVADYGEPDVTAAERRLALIAHRGPDGRGTVSVGADAWLGHRRLAIVDLEGGDQPLASRGEGLWMVGNGEIYNHDEVRRALGAGRFATASDNEVALHLIDAHGPEGLGRLEGMYAFVAAGADGRFVAARDPVGIKPLYWARRDGRVRFASEIAAFDHHWLPDVRPFPPGCFWTPAGGMTRFAHAIGGPARGRAPDGGGVEGPSVAQLVAVRDVIVEAVESQMMGDVPVGVFLSGGLDSSLVAAIAARWAAARGMRLQTFAVGLEGSPDLVAARAAAAVLGTDHHERVYSADEAAGILGDVVRSIESFEPSLVRSAVPNYMLAELASQHVKVVLTGEGADEIFAGYEYLRGYRDPGDLHGELVRMVEGLHNLNLQRCDRVTMAHGLEARVPFLDRRVIDHALSLPPEWKLSGPERAEKHLLRRAFTGWLPDELLWRTKAEFGDGSGAAGALRDRIAATVTDADLRRERDLVDPPIRTREELAYHRILREHLPGLDATRALGRFATA